MGEAVVGGPTHAGGYPDAERAVCDRARLLALARTGLGPAADPEMDRIADWVRRALGVPTALVSLVQVDRQVFPGMVGLPEPAAAERATPLTHSFCQHVVASAQPLVIRDARAHPLVWDNLAIPDLGVVAYAGVPLTDERGRVLGSLCAIDGRPRDWSDDDLATLHDIARSCSAELRLRLARYDAGIEAGRRDLVEQWQQQVVRELQAAMLTVLPAIDGLSMAARYRPADSRLNVGGDWYDAIALRGARDRDGQAVAVSVGDVIGHDLPAVTLMGQVRWMLRQAAWDHSAGPPTAVFGAFEAANRGIGPGAAGTAVVAHMHRPPGAPWVVRWTNAGHPAPLLLRPDGRTELLADHDALFGFAITDGLTRTDHELVVEPGSTLFLYSDGLVERPGSDIDETTRALVALLDGVRDDGPEAVVTAAMESLPENTHDDVVAFAVHFHADPPG